MSADGLVGVEARHLAALQAVAEERSFSRAAERLGYAQSAVSQQIAALERAVGLKLVERPGGPRPVSLTEAGEVVLRHADRLLARLGALRADLDQLVAGESGRIRVGTFQSAGARILPGVIREFRSRWPEVRVEIREELDESLLLDGVAAGALDLTFASRRRPCRRSSTTRCCSRIATCCSRRPAVRTAGARGDAARARRPRRHRAAGRRVVRRHALSAPGRPPARRARRSSAPTTTSRSCAWSARASGTRSCPSSRPSPASTPTSRSCPSRASDGRAASRSSGTAIATARGPSETFVEIAREVGAQILQPARLATAAAPVAGT